MHLNDGDGQHCSTSRMLQCGLQVNVCIFSVIRDNQPIMSFMVRIEVVGGGVCAYSAMDDSFMHTHN